ncbi:hypothetical protein ACOMHN_017566 [Nucella lapillus]
MLLPHSQQLNQPWPVGYPQRVTLGVMQCLPGHVWLNIRPSHIRVLQVWSQGGLLGRRRTLCACRGGRARRLLVER